MAPASSFRLRVAFAVAVAVGSIGVIVGWLLAPVVWLSWIFTIAVPLAGMAAYIWAGSVAHRGGLITVEFADSVYYLGFLLTLISLIVSLLAFTGGGQDGDRIAGVVNRFGVALLTTLVGLATRIVLVNFRKAPSDALAESEHALARAGEALRRHLEQLSQDMIVQSRLMNDSLRGAIDLTAAELKAAAEAGKSTIDASTQAVSRAVESASTEIEASVRTGSEAVRESLLGLAEETRCTALPADVLTAALSPAVSRLADTLEDYAEGLQSARGHHEEVAESAAAMASGVADLRRASQGLSSALRDVERGTDRLSRFGQSLERAEGAIEALSGTLAKQRELASRWRSEAEEAEPILTAHRARLQKNLEASQEALAQVHADLAASVRFIREELEARGEPR